MSTRRLLAIALLLPFSALSLYAVAKVGYVGMFDYHRHSPAGWQVFTDLVIALILVLTWLIPEARRKGRNPWPWGRHHAVSRLVRAAVVPRDGPGNGDARGRQAVLGRLCTGISFRAVGGASWREGGRQGGQGDRGWKPLLRRRSPSSRILP